MELLFVSDLFVLIEDKKIGRLIVWVYLDGFFILVYCIIVLIHFFIDLS